MSEEDPTVTTTEETTTTSVTEADENRIPYERFEKVNKQAKDAKAAAVAAEKRLVELTQRLEEREAAGMPELEQLKKRLEQTEKRAQEAEKSAEEKEQQVAQSRAERLVVSAAKNFVDADDAVRFVDLSEIETVEDAERAVKRVAKAKPHLLKGPDKPLPGRVLENGRAVAPTVPGGGMLDREAEANVIADGLKPFLDRWKAA